MNAKVVTVLVLLLAIVAGTVTFFGRIKSAVLSSRLARLAPPDQALTPLAQGADSVEPAEEPAWNGDPLDKPTLNEPHFTFVGSFKLPTRANGTSTAFTTGGLTHRYVKGKLQFFTTSHANSGGLVYEFDYPGVAATGAVPQAKVIRNWGDVYSGHKWVGNNGGNAALSNDNATYGLYFDEKQKRLYWNYGNGYNATNPNNPSFGYSDLNDATGTARGVGVWSLANRPEKFCRGGITPIPPWFADKYTGGKTLGVGFGGYFSIVSTASFGPVLAAITPPDIMANPDRSALKNAPLIGYPHDAAQRAHRDTNYKSFYDNGVYPTRPGLWNPANGVGYWTWSDIIYGAGAWIDTPSMGGILFIAKVGTGNVFYEKSERHAQGAEFMWMVYSPKELAAVAGGTKQQWQIQPMYTWTTKTLPVGPPDQNGYDGDGISQVGGITFDPVSSRLYVLVNGAWKDGVEWYPQMYVYRVGAGQ